MKEDALLPRRLHVCIAQLPANRRQVRRLVVDLCEAVHARHPGRQRHRTYRSTCTSFIPLLRLWRHAVDTTDAGPLGVRFFARDVDREELILLLAHVGVAWMRTSHAARTRVTFPASLAIRRMHSLMRTAILAGLFPRIPPEQADHVATGTVWSRMRAQAAADPGRWSFAVPTDLHGHAPQPHGRDIDHADIERLLSAAEDAPTDRLMVLLLCVTGMRVEALCHVRLADLWDAANARPTERFVIVEKGSRERTVETTPEVRDAVAALVHALPADRPPPSFPFECRRTGEPLTRKGLQFRLQSLCDRAGIPTVTSHSFRRFVVNHAMRKGARLSDVANYIGHENTGTTFRYYWTGAVHEEVNRVLDEAPGEAVRRMTTELQALESQAARVEAEIAALEGAMTEGAYGSNHVKTECPSPEGIDALLERLVQ